MSQLEGYPRIDIHHGSNADPKVGFTISCAVNHLDSEGNAAPCPGYPLCTKAPGGPTEPLQPVPQPECTSCHQFGTGVVQDAIEVLKRRVEKSVGVFTQVNVSDLSMLIAALENHHC